MTIRLHKGDLPDGLDLGPSVAIDTETLGLNPHRDRLCLVQLSRGDGDAELVQIAQGQTRATAEAAVTHCNLVARTLRRRAVMPAAAARAAQAAVAPGRR